MTKKKLEQIRKFVLSVARGLYPDPDFEPEVLLSADRWFLRIDIDVGDESPGRLIGSSASLRFAMASVIAAGTGLDVEKGIRIHVEGNRNGRRSADLNLRPDRIPIEAVLQAAGALVGGRDQKVETTSRLAVASITVPAKVANLFTPAMNKIIRTVGKSRGFLAMIYVIDE